MGAYRDFIPEGEDTGALGAGFQDFVPPKKDKKEDKPEEKEEEQSKPQPAKNNPFARK